MVNAVFVKKYFQNQTPQAMNEVIRVIFVFEADGAEYAVHFNGDKSLLRYDWKILQKGITLKFGNGKHLQFPSVKIARKFLDNFLAENGH